MKEMQGPDLAEVVAQCLVSLKLNCRLLRAACLLNHVLEEVPASPHSPE